MELPLREPQGLGGANCQRVRVGPRAKQNHTLFRRRCMRHTKSSSGHGEFRIDKKRHDDKISCFAIKHPMWSRGAGPLHHLSTEDQSKARSQSLASKLGGSAVSLLSFNHVHRSTSCRRHGGRNKANLLCRTPLIRWTRDEMYHASAVRKHTLSPNHHGANRNALQPEPWLSSTSCDGPPISCVRSVVSGHAAAEQSTAVSQTGGADRPGAASTLL